MGNYQRKDKNKRTNHVSKPINIGETGNIQLENTKTEVTQTRGNR
ncbi:hypothetical protein [Ectobacillus panaciterrae]|nr:hypothetical protein [Ectobacillus panaciterrae]